ncbi:MAG: hypothetical protein JG718_10950 [Candidatus Thiothrix moscowensis]|nr:hypothetical protein [Candidatus Thiothrix moscowensis]
MKPYYVMFLLAFISNQSFANDRCPAGESGCTWNNLDSQFSEKWSSNTQDYASDSSTYKPGFKAILDRVNNIGTTLKDCGECVLDGVTDGVNNIINGSSSNVWDK